MPESRSTRKPAAPRKSRSKAAPAAPKPTTKAVSSAAAFKKRAAGFDVELPSGNVAKIRRPGITDLISKGLFPDDIMPIVQKAINKAQNNPAAAQNALSQEDQASLVSDPKKMAAIMDAMDRITAECVIEPRCAYHRRQQVTDGVLVVDTESKPVMETIPDSERDEEIVYTDEVEMNDKSFIFNYAVGGSSDLAGFREQSGAAVAALADGEGVQHQTE